MAKKKSTPKKDRQKQSSDFSKLPDKALAQQAKGHFEAGEFARAIEMYRHLCKTSPNDPGHRTALAAAYHGRILEVARKGMHQEAMVLLGNMITFCGPTADQGLRLALLLNGGRWQEAASLYAECREALPRKRQAAIETYVAAQLLSGNQALAKSLPAQSVILRQHKLVQEAMAAYAKGEDAQALEQLGTLPSSSPFRDFCFILKALIASHAGQKGTAQELLAKIAASSPFQPLAAACRQTIGAEDKAAVMAASLGPEQALLGALLGLDAKMASLIASQNKAFSHPDSLFQFILSRRQSFGDSIAATLCHALLPHLPAKTIKVYETTFQPLQAFERHRIQALGCELRHDLHGAFDAWNAALKLLSLEQPVNSLRMATIYRHIAGLNPQQDVPDHFIPTFIIPLKESLRHDPGHKPTHLRILHVTKGHPKLYEEQLHAALKDLPKDVDILLLASESAINRGSFKKAARFVERIIAIDPINSKARGLLVNAHLSHGRKLAQSGKFSQAGKEFEAAAGFDRSNSAAGLPQLCLGLVTLLSGEPQKGEELLAKGLSLAGPEALGRFALALEAQQMKLGSKWQKRFNDALRAINKTAPNKETLFGLVKQCRQQKGAQAPHACREILALLDKFIKQALALDYSEAESLTLCAFLQEYGLFPLLQDFAAKAAAKWPGAIIFSYHRYFAKARGGAKVLSERDYDELDYLAGMAEGQHDSKTAGLIDDLIEMSYANGRRLEDDELFSAFMDSIIRPPKGGREIDEDDLFGFPIPKKLLESIEKKKQKEKGQEETPAGQKPEQQRLF